MPPSQNNCDVHPTAAEARIAQNPACAGIFSQKTERMKGIKIAAGAILREL
jgi:hypothetical protein